MSDTRLPRHPWAFMDGECAVTDGVHRVRLDPSKPGSVLVCVLPNVPAPQEVWMSDLDEAAALLATFRQESHHD